MVARYDHRQSCSASYESKHPWLDNVTKRINMRLGTPRIGVISRLGRRGGRTEFHDPKHRNPHKLDPDTTGERMALNQVKEDSTRNRQQEYPSATPGSRAQPQPVRTHIGKINRRLNAPKKIV
jgi:hypothetical protein